MATRLLGGEAGDGFEHQYTSYPSTDEVRVLTVGEQAKGKTANTDNAGNDQEPLVTGGGSRNRSSSGLRKRLIKLKAGFHADKSKRAVADTFIESTKNKPHYMKEKSSNDLLV